MHEIGVTTRAVEFQAESEVHSRLNARIMSEDYHHVKQRQQRPIISAHLRMLRLERDFDAKAFFKQSLDVSAMDRLTASPYAVSAFQFCGCSVVSEFMPRTLRQVIRHKFLPVIQRFWPMRGTCCRAWPICMRTAFITWICK